MFKLRFDWCIRYIIRKLWTFTFKTYSRFSLISNFLIYLQARLVPQDQRPLGDRLFVPKTFNYQISIAKFYLTITIVRLSGFQLSVVKAKPNQLLAY